MLGAQGQRAAGGAVVNTYTIAEDARSSWSVIREASTAKKNRVIEAMAEKLVQDQDRVLAANQEDLHRASDAHASRSLLARLKLDKTMIDSRVRALKDIVVLPDPVGSKYAENRLTNGLVTWRVRVPIGVIMVICEARPHVTLHAAAMCLKSGNTAIIRGGSEARSTNGVLGSLWQETLQEEDLPRECIQVIPASHEEIYDLLQLDDLIDLAVARGGREFINEVSGRSRVPVLKHADGICHVYIDEYADIERAMEIIITSKCSRPETCLAMETLLIAQAMAGHLPMIVSSLRDHGVRVKGCAGIRELVPDVDPADEEDWRTEYLDLVVSIRLVRDLQEAIDHINHYGSHHTDSVVTDCRSCAERFLESVDSATVVANAPTMVGQGSFVGMGAEVGVSTGRIHARGLIGLEELTTYKLAISRDGSISSAMP